MFGISPAHHVGALVPPVAVCRTLVVEQLRDEEEGVKTSEHDLKQVILISR